MDKRKILIVDDDQDIRQLLDLRLRSHGYETAFAADAVMALNVVRHERPDLILLDIGLPGGDGLVVMERMRTFPALAQIPVIVVSAKDPSVSKHDALAAGAQAYFPKPVDHDALLEEIRRTLEPR